MDFSSSTGPLQSVREIVIGNGTTVLVGTGASGNTTLTVPVVARMLKHVLPLAGATPGTTAVSDYRVRLGARLWADGVELPLRQSPEFLNRDTDSSGLAAGDVVIRRLDGGLLPKHGTVRVMAWFSPEPVDPSTTVPFREDGCAWASLDIPFGQVVTLDALPDVGDDKNTSSSNKRAKFRLKRTLLTGDASPANGALSVRVRLRDHNLDPVSQGAPVEPDLRLAKPLTGESLIAAYGNTGNADYNLSGGGWTSANISLLPHVRVVTIPAGATELVMDVIARPDNLTENNLIVMEVLPDPPDANEEVQYSPGPTRRAEVLLWDGPEFTLHELADSRWGDPNWSYANTVATGINGAASPQVSGWANHLLLPYSTAGGFWQSTWGSINDVWNVRNGGTSPLPYGIANSGMLAGLSGNRAFRRSGSTTTLLPPTTGTSGAYGINPAGTDSIHYIVGFSPAAGESRPAVWVNGGNPRDLVQNLADGGDGMGLAVNDLGEVVGRAVLATAGLSRPFRSKVGAAFLGAGDELPVPTGAFDNSGSANAISVGGGAGGWFRLNEFQNPKVATYWDPRSGNNPNGSGKNLSRWVPPTSGPADKLSEALGVAQVNGTDWSVGWSGDDETLSASNSKLKAVFMKGVGNPPVWRDLNDRHFTHGMTGWSLKKATAVNAQGWIVGNGFLNGTARGFLLVPRTAGQ
jgi:hypothetical protein